MKIIVLAVIGVLVLGLAAAYLFFPSESIRTQIEVQASKALDQKVEVQGVGLSLFPLGISIRGLSVGDSEMPKPYFASLESILVQAKIAPLLSKKLEISSIHIEKPILKYRETTSAQKTIEPAQETQTSAQEFDLVIDAFSISDGRIEMLNEKGELLYGIGDLDQTLALRLLKDQSLSISGSTVLTQIFVKTELGDLGRGLRLQLDQDLLYLPSNANATKETLDIKKANLYVDDIPFSLKGEVLDPSGNDPFIDLELQGGPGNISNLLAYVPASLFKGQSKLTSEGKLQAKISIQDHLSAFSSGTFSEKTSFWIKLSEGKLQHGSYPNITNAFIEVSGSPSSVNIQKIAFQTPKSNIQISGSAAQAGSRYRYNVQSDGNIDAHEVSQLVEIDPLTGQVSYQLKAQSKDQNDFPELQGKLGVKNLTGLVLEGYPKISIVEADVGLEKQNLNIAVVETKIGQSDFALSGVIKNALAYALAQPGKEPNVDIQFKASSSVIDYDELFPESQDVETEEESNLYPTLKPFSGRISFSTGVIKAYGTKIENAHGTMVLDHGKISLSPFSANMFAGSFSGKGDIVFHEDKGPSYDLSTSFSDIEMQKLLDFSPKLSKITGLKSILEGKGNITASSKGNLTNDFSPILSQLSSKGDIEFLKTKLSGHPIQNSLSGYLDTPSMKVLNIDRWKQNFSIEEGKLFVKNANLQAKEYSFLLNGWQSIDGNIQMDLDVTLPPSFESKISNKIPKTLIATMKNDRGINLPFIVQGQQMSPKLTLNEKQIGSSVKSQAKSEAKQESKEAIKKVVPKEKKEEVKEKTKDLGKKIKKLF